MKFSRYQDRCHKQKCVFPPLIHKSSSGNGEARIHGPLSTFQLCLSKISKCLSGWGYFSFIILADAHFPHDTPHKSVFDLPFARCAPAGEPGSAPPNRRASAIHKKSPKIDSSGPPIMGLAVPHLERLALSVGHRPARNGRGLASQGLSSFLDL